MEPAPRRPRTLLIIVSVAIVAAVLAIGWLAASGARPDREVVTWFWRARYAVLPVKGETDLAELHRNPSRRDRERCVACHQDKTSSKLVLHRIHLRSDLLRNLECPDCHQDVGLEKRGNSAVVSWVDVGFCKGCHSEFPGLKPGSRMKPEYFERDCTECHSGDKAPRHDKPYLPRAIPASECKGCHGGRTLPSTVRHEAADWLQAHGQEALESGSERCYSCHDFGLKFCDTCHGKKPPSHEPAERWRTIHPEAARSDTRVCYSCHRTSFCKKCHLNHEAGWLARHASFVRESGDASCLECHSRSSCGYCHMQTSASVVPTGSGVPATTP